MVLVLEDPTWGEQWLRAYQMSRRAWSVPADDDGFPGYTPTYRTLVERLGSVGVFTSDRTLVEFKKLATVPRQRRTRTVAWAALTAMGFDPAAFGLTDGDAPAPFALGDLRSRLQPWAGDAVFH